MLPRLVRIINISVALALVLIAFAVYWYAVRPLPKTSGELEAPIVGPATVVRDARGIPHIEASRWQDAIFLQGFVTAQDRLWQMDVLRRYAAGELSEVFGPAALATDQQARRMRLRNIAEANIARLRPSDRAVLVEYARGVNYFVDTHRGDYPLEFSLPGHVYDPRPWTMADSMLVGLVMYQDLTDSAKFEFDKGTLLDGGADAAKVRTLFPATQGQYLSPGSNAWVVSGAHTGSGKPMAANDPHLSFGIPPTWHLIHLKAPGLNVSGAALPGLPCVITGHNEQIAWGVTNLQADVMDLYSEQLDQQTGRYLFKGNLEQAQLDRQMIAVKGAKPVELDSWVTRHGPVLLQAAGKSYSVRWTAAEGFAFPFFDLDRAQNWSEFRASLHDFWGPGQNFVYADRTGNIGYQATGRVPIRRGFTGDVPLDGSSGNFEWDGYIPFEQLPSVYNPAPGIIATSNQDPFPPDYAYAVNGSYADRYRIQQVRTLLSAKPKLSVNDMLAVQKDVYSAYDRFLARKVVTAFDRLGSSDAMVREAVAVLRSWNGQMDKDEAAPMITELLNNWLGTVLVRQTMLPSMVYSAKMEPQRSAEKTGGRPRRSVQGMITEGPKVPAILPRPQVIETLLRTQPTGWLAKDDWDGWLLSSLATALQDGRARQGSPVSKWKWGRLLTWTFAHPVGKQLPFVDRYFDIGPVEMSGSGTTIKQTTATLGPSERMVADLSDWDRSVQNVTTGESGHVASKHYKDEWAAYYVGKSFPMEFDRLKAVDILRIRPSP
ncbi:MAG: penicillin acylase family protein [Acidobacteriota bacterium]|nr:penicillin acylase family protein [Acidobacteriota bacterium]